jgi:mRNA (guanine-N7-)-methyltransferase
MDKEKHSTKNLATETPFHNEIFAAKKDIAEAYDHKHNENFAERRSSPIYELRTTSNWIKSCLIKGYSRPSSRVLDLGCGHGGDLLKYAACNIGLYVGADLSAESLKEAVKRYNSLPSVNFPAKFVCADISEQSVNSPEVLEAGIEFDLVSSQLGLQYVWTGERQLRTFFHNVTDRLVPGGFFIGCYPDPMKILERLKAAPDHKTITIGDICQIKFHKSFEELQGTSPYGIVYEVTLGEVMENVPEYLVSPPIMEKMAEEYGLLPILQMNFQDFYSTFRNVPPYAGLLRTHNAPASQNAIPAAEWEVMSLYSAFVFQKQFAAGVRSPMVMESDIIHLQK